MPRVRTAAHIRAPGCPVNTASVRVSCWTWCNGMRGECRIAAGGLGACERIKHLHVCWMRHRPGEAVAPVSRSSAAVSRGDVHSVAPQQEPHGPPFLSFPFFFFFNGFCEAAAMQFNPEKSVYQIFLSVLTPERIQTVQERQPSSCFGFLGFLLLLDLLSHNYSPTGSVQTAAVDTLTVVALQWWLWRDSHVRGGCSLAVITASVFDLIVQIMNGVIYCIWCWCAVITTHNEPIHGVQKNKKKTKQALVWTKHL